MTGTDMRIIARLIDRAIYAGAAANESDLDAIAEEGAELTAAAPMP